MADLTVNPWGIVLILEDEEVREIQAARNDVEKVVERVAGKAFELAKIGAELASIAFKIIAGYFEFMYWQIENANKAGCGVYLTLPYYAIWASTVTGFISYLGAIVAGPKPCVVVRPVPPITPPPDTKWSEMDSGNIVSEDRDTIAWSIQHAAVPNNQVAIKLIVGQNSSGWKKTVNMPSNDGQTSWDITAEGKGAKAESGLYTNELGDQQLTFYKAKFLGVMTKVLHLGNLNRLRGGDRVTFTWETD